MSSHQMGTWIVSGDAALTFVCKGLQSERGVSLKCNKSGPPLSDCKPKAKNTLTQEEVASMIRTVSPLRPRIAKWDWKLKMAHACFLGQQ